MHGDEDRPIERERERKSGRGALGGTVAALAVLALKFKTALAFLFSAKWLFFAPKLLVSFGSMFLSIWFYALAFGGWKIGVVFVLMILVHELGHFVTWRNFGVPASLPTFIPGLGAFVTAPRTGTAAQNVAASLAGPFFGMLAAAACWGYGAATGETFWYACAYIGFFLNLFNLIPTPPFDGGAIAGAIDARLWIVGLVVFVGWIVVHGLTPFSLVFLLLVGVTALPRIVAMRRGIPDPYAVRLAPGRRAITALAYFALILLGVAGAAATNVTRPPVS